MSSTARQGPVVTARDLTRVFGRFTAVDRVSFAVERGEIFGFLGSNGAGKTTTIRILCGLLRPSSGDATVAGFDVVTEAARIKTSIGYMSQRFSLYGDLTVEENLRFWSGAYRLWGKKAAQRHQWAIEVGGLEQQRRILVRELPGGFRQRLALGCALLHEPPVVFLDEPTGGVDPEARRRFWDLIDQLAAAGTTVFVTTHYMDEAERCHRVALMHAGKLLALDSVHGLRSVFRGSGVLEIELSHPARAIPLLEELPGVTEVALFGERLHTTVDDPELAATVARALQQAGIEATVQPVTPSLEDVFIHVIRRAENGRLQ